VGIECNDFSALPCGKSLSKEKTSAECSLAKDYLRTPATLIEETSIGAGEFMEDSSPHDSKAVSEGSKRIYGKEIHSQENVPPRRRRRRRSNRRGIALAPDRRHRQSNRNGTQHKKKHRHRHQTHSSVARSRVRKRTSDIGTFLSPETRKEGKTMSGRTTRYMMRRLAEDDMRNRPRRSTLPAESENDEMSCVHLIVICTKELVDFFRGFVTGW